MLKEDSENWIEMKESVKISDEKKTIGEVIKEHIGFVCRHMQGGRGQVNQSDDRRKEKLETTSKKTSKEIN